MRILFQYVHCLLQVILAECYMKNIPILPEAFMTFASKSSIGPSCAAHWPYTNQVLTLCADFSGTERDREKEQVQTIKGPPLGGA